MLYAYTCNNQLLLKIHTDRDKDYYWTIVRIDGQIMQMPTNLQTILAMKDWT